jgi:hypothetical protein
VHASGSMIPAPTPTRFGAAPFQRPHATCGLPARRLEAPGADLTEDVASTEAGHAEARRCRGMRELDDDIRGAIVDASVRIHQDLGPGLFGVGLRGIASPTAFPLPRRRVSA